MTPATPSLAGKVIFVTGATDGIGQETARALAVCGATVIIHARTPARGEATTQALRREHPTLDLAVAVADFRSLAEVRALAADVATRFPRIDVLVNNAGFMTTTPQVSAEGHELTFAVNHLAPFLLTNLLLDVFKATAPARIITVSSGVHRTAELDFADLDMTRGWESHMAYARSKLANVLFTYHLADRLTGTGVTANALEPGIIGTKLLRTGFGFAGASVAQGAATSIFLATEPSVAQTTGTYFAQCQVTPSAPITYDLLIQQQLWDASARMVGLA